MKRELKVALLYASAPIASGFKTDPDEKGTERLDFGHYLIGQLPFQD